MWQFATKDDSIILVQVDEQLFTEVHRQELDKFDLRNINLETDLPQPFNSPEKYTYIIGKAAFGGAHYNVDYHCEVMFDGCILPPNIAFRILFVETREFY